MRTKLAPMALTRADIDITSGVGNVAVGEHDLVDVVLLDQLGELGLFEDGDSLGIELAGQRGRVFPARECRESGWR